MLKCLLGVDLVTTVSVTAAMDDSSTAVDEGIIQQLSIQLKHHTKIYNTLFHAKMSVIAQTTLEDCLKIWLGHVSPLYHVHHQQVQPVQQ